MRTMVFSSIKGGVGKTTMAVHVAAGLADSGIRTLLVDLDPQGHASLMAGVEISTDDPCVVDTFGPKPAKKLHQVVVQTERENLLVAPASSRMIDMERDLFRWGHRLQAIERSLKKWNDSVNALVIDTPPQLNAYSETALAAATMVVVPIPAMAHALQGLDEINAAWEDVTEGQGGGMVGAINMWDRRTTATNAAMEDAFKDLPIKVARNRIPRAEALNQAGLAYEMIYDYSATSPASVAFYDLTTELWRLAGKYEG